MKWWAFDFFADSTISSLVKSLPILITSIIFPENKKGCCCTRAILGNPSILLLDEATSALDAESESEVQEGLNRAMKNRTVIVIAHRLATTQEANKIVVFDKGEIIEVGKHIDLINKPGIYKELCEKQLIKKL